MTRAGPAATWKGCYDVIRSDESRLGLPDEKIQEDKLLQRNKKVDSIFGNREDLKMNTHMKEKINANAKKSTTFKSCAIKNNL